MPESVRIGVARDASVEGKGRAVRRGMQAGLRLFERPVGGQRLMWIPRLPSTPARPARTAGPRRVARPSETHRRSSGPATPEAQLTPCPIDDTRLRPS